MNKKLLALLTLLFLVGCVSAPTPELVAAADYGSFPSDSERTVKDYLAKRLKDPDSALFREFTAPTRVYVGNRIEGVKFGYMVCATYNAKNSYGAYVGYSRDGFLIKNGSVIAYFPDGENFGRDVCTY
jgi:hypothetical protein